jgi:D-galacturonate reductase
VIERFAREVAYVELGGSRERTIRRLAEMARDYNDLAADRQVVAAVEAMEAILAKAAAGEPNAVVEVNGRSGGLAFSSPASPNPKCFIKASSEIQNLNYP